MSRVKDIQGPADNCVLCHEPLEKDIVDVEDMGRMHSECYENSLPPLERALRQLERFEYNVKRRFGREEHLDLTVRLFGKYADTMRFMLSQISEPKSEWLQTVVVAGLKASTALYLKDVEGLEGVGIDDYAKLFNVAYIEAKAERKKKEKSVTRN